MKVFFSFPLLMVYALLVLAMLIRSGKPKPAMAGAFLMALAVYLMCTPLMTGLLVRVTGDFPPLTDSRMLLHDGVQAIVVAGGGRYRHAEIAGGREVAGQYSLGRVRYGAQLARETGLPVLVTGIEAEGMARTLESDYGIHPRWVEPDSLTTAENAERSAHLLLPQQVRRIALVTDAWHMERARFVFTRAGFQVVNAPTGYPLGYIRLDTPWWYPRNDLFQQNIFGLSEWMGQIQYRLRFRGEAPVPVPGPAAGPANGS